MTQNPIVEIDQWSVAVTDGPGGEGIAIDSVIDTGGINLANSHQFIVVEYKVNSGAWQRLDGGCCTTLPCDLAIDIVKLRRTTWEGGAVNVVVTAHAPDELASLPFGLDMLGSVVLLGDSSTKNGHREVWLNGVLTPRSITNRAIVDTANAMSGLKMNIVHRAGKGGDRLDQMFARYDSDVAPHKPTLLVVMGGANDLDQFRSARQAFAWLMRIYKRARKARCAVLYLGSTGRARGNTNTTPSPVDGKVYKQSHEYAALYNLARKAAQKFDAFRFFDLSKGTRDYARSISATDASMGKTRAGAFAPLTDGTVDPSHVGPFGVILSAVPLARYLVELFGHAPPDRSTLNGYGGYGDQAAVGIGNTLMMGATNLYIAAPNTGFGPSDIVIKTGSGTIEAICDTVERIDDGPGRALELKISGATATTDYIEIAGSKAYTGDVNIDAWIQGGLNVIAAAAGGIHNFFGDLEFRGAGSAILHTISFGESYTGDRVPANEGFSGSVNGTAFGLSGPFNFGSPRSPRCPVPAGTVSLLYRGRIQTTPGAQLTVHVTEFGPHVDLETAEVDKYLS